MGGVGHSDPQYCVDSPTLSLSLCISLSMFMQVLVDLSLFYSFSNDYVSGEVQFP